MFLVLFQLHKNTSLYKPISNAIKQQYLVSERDIRSNQYSQFSHCIGNDEMIIWKNYMSHQKYVRKNVVLVVDHGGSLSKTQLLIAKSIGKFYF